MRYNTVQDLVLKCERNGVTTTPLVITRKTPPKNDYITVKNIGKAYVMNAQQRKDKLYDIVASFKVSDLKKWVEKCESMIRAGLVYKDSE